MEPIIGFLILFGINCVIGYVAIKAFKTNDDTIGLLQRELGNTENIIEQWIFEVQKLEAEKKELEKKLQVEIENNKKILSQKKSSETNLGQISENLAPFLENFPYDPKDCQFLGNPLDYIVYDLDQGQIVFIEVKSGGSKPSKKQRTIKNIIQSGRVFYEEMRINNKGVKIKRAKNNE